MRSKNHRGTAITDEEIYNQNLNSAPGCKVIAVSVMIFSIQLAMLTVNAHK
jgi:hypothetical protein